MRPIEQQFFNDLEKKLWTAADKLRSNLDTAVYKHVVLGLDKMNTDAAVPDLNRENVYRLELVKPSESGLNDFDELVGRIRQAMRENETESRSLAELRDTLPPKLLSGEIAVDSLAEENM
ncbi:MAG TPA: hypothetical protein DD803_09640 [Alcaligenes faecalis]|nr:hypothetical protein [Alcaligenes faecalis]